MGQGTGIREQRRLRGNEPCLYPALAPGKSRTNGARNIASSSEFWLDVVAQGEDVAVRIFEPCHLISGGSGPDSQLLIGDERVFFG